MNNNNNLATEIKTNHQQKGYDYDDYIQEYGVPSSYKVNEILARPIDEISYSTSEDSNEDNNLQELYDLRKKAHSLLFEHCAIFDKKRTQIVLGMFGQTPSFECCLKLNRLFHKLSSVILESNDKDKIQTLIKMIMHCQ